MCQYCVIHTYTKKAFTVWNSELAGQPVCLFAKSGTPSQNHLEDLLNHRWLSPIPSSFWYTGRGWGWKFCISNKNPSCFFFFFAAAAVDTTLWELHPRRIRKGERMTNLQCLLGGQVLGQALHSPYLIMLTTVCEVHIVLIFILQVRSLRTRAVTWFAQGPTAQCDRCPRDRRRGQSTTLSVPLPPQTFPSELPWRGTMRSDPPNPPHRLIVNSGTACVYLHHTCISDTSLILWWTGL